MVFHISQSRMIALLKSSNSSIKVPLWVVTDVCWTVREIFPHRGRICFLCKIGSRVPLVNLLQCLDFVAFAPLLDFLFSTPQNHLSKVNPLVVYWSGHSPSKQSGVSLIRSKLKLFGFDQSVNHCLRQKLWIVNTPCPTQLHSLQLVSQLVCLRCRV